MQNRSPFFIAFLLSSLIALAAADGGALAQDSVEVTDVWARATVPGQKVAGVYATIRSRTEARLIGVRSPVAKSGEIHSMSNDGGVMKMRRLDGLELPAGRPVTLAPGGIHIMLLDVSKVLEAGQRVPLTLTIEQGGKKLSIAAEAEVRAIGATSDEHKHH